MQIPILRSTHKTLTEKIAGLKKDIDGNSKEIGRAAELGDLKENSAYHSARERQVLLLERMQRYKGYLDCRIVDLNGSAPDKVTFGTTVTVVDAGADITHTFNIVGPAEYELDKFPDMVTFAAPMARLLMGKKVGDKFDCPFGARPWVGLIQEIKPLE